MPLARRILILGAALLWATLSYVGLGVAIGEVPGQPVLAVLIFGWGLSYSVLNLREQRLRVERSYAASLSA